MIPVSDWAQADAAVADDLADPPAQEHVARHEPGRRRDREVKDDEPGHDAVELKVAADAV